ncbi:MAG: protoheme ferro-lyase [Glaciecola sp.]
MDLNNASHAYQSVFGPAKGVRPASSGRIEEFARGGTQRVLVKMLGFLSYGLETLEPIWVERHNGFLAAGSLEFY